MTRLLIVFFLIWIILFGVAHTIFYFALGIERLDALKNFGKTTNGIVAAKYPHDHQSIVYYYTIDGIQYTGSGSAGKGNPDFDSLQIGDKVIVKYDEQGPLNSYLGYPDYQAESDSQIGFILSVLISTAIAAQALGIFLIVRYIRKSRSKDHVNSGL